MTKYYLYSVTMREETNCTGKCYVITELHSLCYDLTPNAVLLLDIMILTADM